jgi:diketogulonate reductase-like aldo/keto reductase
MAVNTLRTVRLPTGETIPALGQGTWGHGEDPTRRKSEIAALRSGVELGMRLIDTAEMYADGEAERLVGEAVSGIRDEVFLVSKVMPHHATRTGTLAACEASLRRLKTDRIDLYLLHWPAAVPLEDTIDAFTALERAGRIRHWGISNFDLAGMGAVLRRPGGVGVQTDQVLYNLVHRGIEWDLLPWCQARGIPLMAYSPFERGRMLEHPVLQAIAARLEATPAQVALAWVLRLEGVVTIPRASRPAHTLENHGALGVRLTEADFEALEKAFPAPPGPVPLEVL